MKINQYDTKKLEMNNKSGITIILEDGNEVSITINDNSNVQILSIYSELAIKPIASNNVTVKCVDARIPKTRCKFFNNNYVTKILYGCKENGKCVDCKFKNIIDYGRND